MNTQNEISLLADQALDAVVGGRMKLPGVTDAPQRGVVGSVGPMGYAVGASILSGVIGFAIGLAFL